MSDLIERLRNFDWRGKIRTATAHQAADRIEALTAENERHKRAFEEHGGRYWEARYRDEAAENERLRIAYDILLKRMVDLVALTPSAALVIDRALSPAMDAQPTTDAATVEALEVGKTWMNALSTGANIPAHVQQMAKEDLPKFEAAIRQLAPRDDVAGIVAWLRAEAQLCDCHAHEQGECACGAWDTEPGERSYKRANIEDLADAIERGDFRQQGEPRT